MTKLNYTVYQPSYVHPTVKIGKDTQIGAFCDIGKDVIIGERCNIQCHVRISNGVMMGNDVFIAPNVTILNDLFPVTKCLLPPIINNGAIICGSVTVNPNVIIGYKSIVVSDSLVTKNIPPHEVWKGSPAKFHMTRDEYDQKKETFIKDFDAYMRW